MAEFRIRTEDYRDEEILDNYVKTERDQQIVDKLKSTDTIILVGSRGTGKSYLLRVAKAELVQSFGKDKLLPVYVSFVRSSLVHTNDPHQFLHWMLARLCSDIVRSLSKHGIVNDVQGSLSILASPLRGRSGVTHKIEAIAKQYEESYRRPGTQIDATGVPSVEQFKNAVEDICINNDLRRIVLLFDEAAHVFRPEQQRSFFTLFRDLRSPYINCNAAVYPGTTSYGDTFQLSHDATVIEISRSLTDKDYRDSMFDIVHKQADSTLIANIERYKENFYALAYAVSGNPRLLLKTVAKAPRMNSTEVESVLKNFYRTEIWSEHTALAETFVGHRKFVDWGRKFIENTVIPDTRTKNQQRAELGRAESTCYFWIHRDAPEAVNEALRLLAYTGIVTLIDTGIVATRAKIGTRYAINLGCLTAVDPQPIATITRIAGQLSIKRFTEFGENANTFADLVRTVGAYQETDMTQVLQTQLAKPTNNLDITDYQKECLVKLGFDTIGKALLAEEMAYQRAEYIGPVRSRRMKNAVVSSVLEYLSG